MSYIFKIVANSSVSMFTGFCDDTDRGLILGEGNLHETIKGLQLDYSCPIVSIRAEYLLVPIEESLTWRGSTARIIF